MSGSPPPVPPLKLPEPFTSIAELVERLTADHPADPALRSTARSLSRRELADDARTLAVGWLASGLEVGDVVGLTGESGPALALAMLSAARAGLVPLLLDPRLTPEESRVVFDRARPRALAVCDRIPWAGPEALPRFEFDAQGCAPLAAAGREAAGAPPLVSDPHAPAVLLVTSGSSGHPRVVALSAENISSNIRGGCQAHSCGRGEVFLSLLPMTHAFELTTGFLGPLACVAAVVFPGSRNPNRLLSLVAAEGVTRVNVVPAVLSMMLAELRDAEEGREILAGLRGRLRSIMCGGAPVAPELASRVVRHHLPLWVGYGLTEAAPIVALGSADQLPPGSTGRPIPGVEVRIEEGSGEVLVRGPNVMKGYVGDEQATRAAFQDGWLRTGDIGRLDEEGHLFIMGRRRELIVTSGGLKLLPDEIESAYRSPWFAEVCAIGVPDPAGGGGERPHLVVVPASPPGSGASPTTPRCRGG
jgi:long-chain acyl-CoA synthetase